jgi:hypothetical protein
MSQRTSSVRLSGRDRKPWQDSRLYRERAMELAPQIRRMKRYQIAVHEAGHFLVAAYLGDILDSIGHDVSSFVQMGVVVPGTTRSNLSRSDRAAMLAAGGLAQARHGIPATVGTGSDEQQLAALGLSERAIQRARFRSASLVELLWSDIELLATVLLDHTVLSGETAIAYVIAAQPNGARVLARTDERDYAAAYAAIVNGRRRPAPASS